MFHRSKCAAVMFLIRRLPYFGDSQKSDNEDSKAKKSEQKTYHKKATGLALTTAKRHSKDHDLKLFGSCFW